ncbi:MAG: SUMF1/EgtB/PvdO family nonheme iron enzyme [Candidatus Anammoximicrobium sp.]|nr:SUMF1/EgtB/PvdO family nonheme iron enzyme [Candidatus Anammoximicrobium sp.]
MGLFPAGASRWLAERTGKLVCDLSGNVWEWCATKWRDSCAKPADGSPEGTASRIIRGGCYGNEPKYVCCGCRYWYVPRWHWFLYWGFRCVQQLSSSSVPGS